MFIPSFTPYLRKGGKRGISGTANQPPHMCVCTPAHSFLETFVKGKRWADRVHTTQTIFSLQPFISATASHGGLNA